MVAPAGDRIVGFVSAVGADQLARPQSFRALPVNGKIAVLFATADLRDRGMEAADLVAVVDDAFDIGIVPVAYATALVLPSRLYLTVIRRVATGEHWIADITARRPSPRAAVRSATAAIGLAPTTVDILARR